MHPNKHLNLVNGTLRNFLTFFHICQKKRTQRTTENLKVICTPSKNDKQLFIQFIILSDNLLQYHYCLRVEQVNTVCPFDQKERSS